MTAACWYCGRTSEHLESCCGHHPDQFACADRAGCRDFILAGLRAPASPAPAPDRGMVRLPVTAGLMTVLRDAVTWAADAIGDRARALIPASADERAWRAAMLAIDAGVRRQCEPLKRGRAIALVRLTRDQAAELAGVLDRSAGMWPDAPEARADLLLAAELVTACMAASTGPAPITPAGLLTMRTALADAARYRTDRGAAPCPDCVGSPAELCPAHEADLALAASYLELARRIGGDL